MKTQVGILRRFNVRVQDEANALPGPRAIRSLKLNLSRAFALRDVGLKAVPVPSVHTRQEWGTALAESHRSAGYFPEQVACTNLASGCAVSVETAVRSQGRAAFQIPPE